ncbi:MAG: response regulator [Cyanobacteria bacterium P01_D01_bin.156]
MTATILLIEDSPTDAAILSAAFEEVDCSHTLQVISNGYEALGFLQNLNQYIQTNIPCIILLDLNLPGKDGYEILHEIKSNHSWRTIPTIIFSSSSASSDISKSYQLHANAYITKPIDFDEYKLVARVIHNFWLKTVQLPSDNNIPE